MPKKTTECGNTCFDRSKVRIKFILEQSKLLIEVLKEQHQIIEL